MNRRHALGLGAVALLAAAAGTGIGVWRQPGPAGVAPGAALPPNFWELRFARPEEGEITMAEFRGQPLVINFWATWCPPCVRELPALDGFAQSQSGPGGVRVLGIAVDAPTPVRAFVKQTGLKLPVAVAGLDGGELARQLGNAQGGLPFTVMLAADGRLLHSRLGETSLAELNEWTRSLKAAQKTQ